MFLWKQKKVCCNYLLQTNKKCDDIKMIGVVAFHDEIRVAFLKKIQQYVTTAIHLTSQI